MPILQHIIFWCAAIHVCLFCAAVSEMEYTVIKGGRPATHVSPEGEETRHHIARRGEGKRPTEGRETERSTANEGEEGVVEVSRHPLYCWAAAVKTR